MSKFFFGVLILCGLFGFWSTATVQANQAVDGDEPAMMASPSTIVLAKVDKVTIHTNIPASSVEPGTLALNGVEPFGVGVDDLGHIVGKFAVADLNLEPEEATLTLTGLFTDGTSFSASDVVGVK